MALYRNGLESAYFSGRRGCPGIGSEAQEIAETVLDAEAKIGELTAKIPKASGMRTDLQPTDNSVERSKEKALSEIGIQQKTAERFERLAKHPEAIRRPFLHK